MDSVGIQQQDGGEHLIQLRLDHQHEAFEHARQRRAAGDHLEDLRLGVAERLRQAGLGDVAGHAEKSDDVIALVAQRRQGR